MDGVNGGAEIAAHGLGEPLAGLVDISPDLVAGIRDFTWCAAPPGGPVVPAICVDPATKPLELTETLDLLLYDIRETVRARPAGPDPEVEALVEPAIAEARAATSDLAPRLFAFAREVAGRVATLAETEQAAFAWPLARLEAMLREIDGNERALDALDALAEVVLPTLAERLGPVAAPLAAEAQGLAGEIASLGDPLSAGLRASLDRLAGALADLGAEAADAAAALADRVEEIAADAAALAEDAGGGLRDRVREIAGTEGDDVVEVAGGLLDAVERVLGGAGTDTVRLDLAFADVERARDASGALVISDPAGPVAELVEVERAAFRDGVLVLDLEGPNLRFGYQLYAAALDRLPDEAGLRHWLGRLEAGLGREALADAFAAAPEFRARIAEDPSPEGIVTGLYDDVLGREADPAGLAHWSGALAAGALDLGDLLAAFAASAENSARVAPFVEDGAFLL